MPPSSVSGRHGVGGRGSEPATNERSGGESVNQARQTKGKRRTSGKVPDLHRPLHPALEAFSKAIAEILVDRYLHRKATTNKGNDEASV